MSVVAAAAAFFYAFVVFFFVLECCFYFVFVLNRIIILKKYAEEERSDSRVLCYLERKVKEKKTNLINSVGILRQANEKTTKQYTARHIVLSCNFFLQHIR